jgi:HEAT repeat protein
VSSTLRANAETSRTTDVSKDPALFADLFAGLLDEDRLVRMRAADEVEKVTRDQPELLQPWKRQLLGTVSALEDKQQRWRVAQLLPRLKATPKERKMVLRILMGYLEDGSSIVRTFSMQALAELAMRDGRLLALVMPRIEHLTRTGTPAMKSRAAASCSSSLNSCAVRNEILLGRCWK